MSLVRGENFIFYVQDGGIWKGYVCGRSGTMSIDTEFIETTVTGSGNYKTRRPSVHSFTGSIDGVISLNESGILLWPDLQALQLNKTKMLCRFTSISEDGNTYTKEAYFYINNSTDTGSFDGVATFQLSLIGTGAISQIFTPPTPNNGEVFRYPAMGDTAPTTSGVFTITVPGLGNKTILAVHKDGIGNNDIILSGTPVNKEVLYESSGTDGVFTWAIPFDDGENWYTLYQNI